jgi:hypothetical protein
MSRKQELLNERIVSDPKLTAKEKETSLCFPNDLECGTIYTEVPTIIKWVLSIEESNIRDVKKTEDGEICGLDAQIPKSIIKLQGDSRNSCDHSRMITYGPNK